MNKIAIAIAVLTVPLVYAQQGSAPSWVTVASFSFPNQMQPISPAVSIYTPKEPGLYRISYYTEAISTTLTRPHSSDEVCPSVHFTDDSGQIQQRFPPSLACATITINGQGAALFMGRSDVFVFHAEVAPITVKTTNVTSSTYSVFGTIEFFTGN